MKGKEYHLAEGELGKKLHQLFMVDGEAEVEIVHPTEGFQVITRKEYKAMIKHLDRAQAMTAEEREKESRKIARRKRKKFKKMLLRAKVHTVDINDDTSFGKDVTGKDLAIEGKIFVLPENYPEGTKVLETELGCFVSENLTGPLIRILPLDPLLSPNEAVDHEHRVTH